MSCPATSPPSPGARAKSALEALAGLLDELPPDDLLGLLEPLSGLQGGVSRRLLSLAAGGRRRSSTALLSVEEAAARLGKSKSWLYHSYAAEGLHPRRIGRSLRFREDELEAYSAGRPRRVS